ncbi:hypothetical protein H6P81_007480 [Aristolochia fimbriata]|uniref:Uncharacterized protein n=1 Tax=Aristolochia fimbriata TaxID=158543 RepID=A0AAV7F409_ARIFI|nr:hypothetical protein H6P81_007480 [Aristolochia fimbriata]
MIKLRFRNEGDESKKPNRASWARWQVANNQPRPSSLLRVSVTCTIEYYQYLWCMEPPRGRSRNGRFDPPVHRGCGQARRHAGSQTRRLADSQTLRLAGAEQRVRSTHRASPPREKYVPIPQADVVYRGDKN